MNFRIARFDAIASQANSIYCFAVSLIETMHPTKQGFKLVVPTIVNHVAIRRKRLFPYAISMISMQHISDISDTELQQADTACGN